LTFRRRVQDSCSMTLNVHALIALGAARTADMMVPSRTDMCCRMCA
jgi:hypothetical protein